jgi:hypothetical protein
MSIGVLLCFALRETRPNSTQVPLFQESVT